MPITVQDVLNVAPELKDFSETPEGAAAIAAAIAFATETVDESLWGARYTYGASLLAAHLVLSTNPSVGGVVGGVGSVSSVSVGGVSTSFVTSADVAFFGGAHGSTRQGALYDSILAGLLPAFIYL